LRRDSKRLSAEDNRLRNSAIIRSELGEISRKSSTSGPSRCLKCSLIVSKQKNPARYPGGIRRAEKRPGLRG
jgi:hypothetical protein